MPEKSEQVRKAGAMGLLSAKPCEEEDAAETAEAMPCRSITRPPYGSEGASYAHRLRCNHCVLYLQHPDCNAARVLQHGLHWANEGGGW